MVTGIGTVSAAGIGADRAWEAIERSAPRARTVGLPAVREQDGRFPVYLAPDYRIGEVTETHIAPAQLEREGIDGHRDIKHLVAVSGLALHDAGLDGAAVDRREIGLVVADETSGVERLARTLYASVAAPPRDVHAAYGELSDQVFGLNTFLATYTVARALSLGGECVFVNTACASGLTAIDAAATQIRLGRATVAIAAAADDPLSSGKFRWFADRHLYAVDGNLRPFDPESTGTVFGDGGAAVVVEDEEHALRRGARIYGRVAGAGFTQDGWRVSAPDPAAANQARSVRRALAEAGLGADRVDAFVPHGTGIPLVDKYEARTAQQLWPNPAHRPVCLPLKQFVGHNLGGSSLLETALLLRLMHERRVPAVRRPESDAGVRLGLALPATWSRTPIRYAVKSAVGFGGYYGSIVMEAA